jgi:hypothetical protein
MKHLLYIALISLIGSHTLQAETEQTDQVTARQNEKSIIFLSEELSSFNSPHFTALVNRALSPYTPEEIMITWSEERLCSYRTDVDYILRLIHYPSQRVLHKKTFFSSFDTKEALARLLVNIIANKGGGHLELLREYNNLDKTLQNALKARVYKI